MSILRDCSNTGHWQQPRPVPGIVLSVSRWSLASVWSERAWATAATRFHALFAVVSIESESTVSFTRHTFSESNVKYWSPEKLEGKELSRAEHESPGPTACCQELFAKLHLQLVPCTVLHF